MDDETPPPFDQAARILSIEIRPGSIETFRVTMRSGGTVVVDAAMLYNFDKFSVESITQIRRSFPEPKRGEWSLEVDRALRTAIEPASSEGEQLRFHGESNWGSEEKPWLVYNRLPEQGVGLISGRYSTFKSFVLLDGCGSVTTGLPLYKARVARPGGVLIFAAEGASDVPVRMKALIEHRLAAEISPDLFAENRINLDRLPFVYVDECRPLLNPKTVDWMVAKARQAQDFFQNHFGLDLVFIGIDTLSAAAGWDNENDAAQAQIVMNNLKDVSVATNTCVLAVDHFGKDISSGTRGSIVKESSADFILSTLGKIDPETNVVTDSRLVLRKLRSGPQGLVLPFEAKLVEMGLSRFNEPLTSRVVNWNVIRTVRAPQQRASQSRSVIEQALTETFRDHMESTRLDGVAAEVDAVREFHLRGAFTRLYTAQKQEQDPEVEVTRHSVGMAWGRALKGLLLSMGRGEDESGAKFLFYPPSV